LDVSLDRFEATAVVTSAEARDSHTVIEMTELPSCAFTRMYDTKARSAWNAVIAHAGVFGPFLPGLW
jgi:hypothetical protein